MHEEFINGDGTKKVIHKYLQSCKTNPQPPGFGDFLRGSIAIYNYAKKYNYTLYFDKDIHPIFQHLQKNPYFINDKSNNDVKELIPPLNYYQINNKLIILFENNECFSLITNAFYTKNGNKLENFGEITSECKKFFQYILQPNLLLKNKLFIVFDRFYNIDIESNYKVIHLRFNDNIFLNQNNNYLDLKNDLNYKISNLLNKSNNTQYVLITNSNKMGNFFKKNHNLLYWSNNKTHLGGIVKNDDGIIDTLIDFFILSKAKEIIYFTEGNWLSAFSKMASIIFDIKISNLNDL